MRSRPYEESEENPIETTSRQVPALLVVAIGGLMAIGLGTGVVMAMTLPNAWAGGLMIGLLAYLITALKEPRTFDSGQIRNLFLLCGLLIATERAARLSETELEVRK